MANYSVYMRIHYEFSYTNCASLFIFYRDRLPRIPLRSTFSLVSLHAALPLGSLLASLTPLPLRSPFAALPAIATITLLSLRGRLRHQFLYFFLQRLNLCIHLVELKTNRVSALRIGTTSKNSRSHWFCSSE